MFNGLYRMLTCQTADSRQQRQVGLLMTVSVVFTNSERRAVRGRRPGPYSTLCVGWCAAAAGRAVRTRGGLGSECR